MYFPFVSHPRNFSFFLNKIEAEIIKLSTQQIQSLLGSDIHGLLFI